MYGKTSSIDWGKDKDTQSELRVSTEGGGYSLCLPHLTWPNLQEINQSSNDRIIQIFSLINKLLII